MKSFTSTARKDGRWWVVQCDQEPSALSQVARLDQAADHQREAISMVTGIDESQIEVTVKPELHPAIRLALSSSREKRAEAEKLQREASEEFELAASMLREDGFSMRDAGAILGVSHQRVAQLLEATLIEARAEVLEAKLRADAVRSGRARSATSGRYVTKTQAAKGQRTVEATRASAASKSKR